MNDRFAPIFHASPLAHPAPTCIPAPRPQILDEARVQPDYLAMDEVSDWAQNYRPARPADPDDVFSQDEDAEDVLELLAQRPAPTPNGKYVGIALDACEALRQIITTIRGQDNFDQFSEVDVDKWAAICRRAGYRNV